MNFLSALLWTVIVLLLTGACPPAGPETPDQILRRTLIERLIPDAANDSVRETELVPAKVRLIVRDRLPSGLLDSLDETSGKDFRFVPNGAEGEAHVALLILTYTREQDAASASRKLAQAEGYFERTKILTRFSSARVSKQVLIVFTENAGNDAVVDLVLQAPVLFASP